MGKMGVLMVATLAMFGVMTGARSAPQAPCLFIFGDSLVDNGNNNGILTLARANYMPYGIDFPEGSSGRFTNGRTTVDVLAQLLGFRDFIPPFATTKGPAILRGLNYASGAAGIRNETGRNLGEHFAMPKQIEHFGETVEKMKRLFRGNTTKLCEYLSKCIFVVGLGSNDYLNNYFMPTLYSSSYEYSPRTYATLLLQDYRRSISKLYDMGARKVLIWGVGPIGCIPYELARYHNHNNGSRCNDNINKAIMLFNAGLLRIVKDSNAKFDDANFIYVNTFDSMNDILQNSASYGFEVLDKGCCGVGRNSGQITCLPLQRPCQDRSKYVFWDAFHPTEVANVIFAKRAYASTSLSDVYPMNIRQLAMA